MHSGQYALAIAAGFARMGRMAEIAKFVRHGAYQITPKILTGVRRKLPMLKVEFTQIQAPKFPHLVEQLEFLADLVEDFADNAEQDIPYSTAAAATFALIYAHRQTDLIPDNNLEFGWSDDSGVVRAVLIEHEKVLADYANRHGLNWSRITVKA
jgi:uncharacterized membrane protein YkvA (DUF1232 family)